MNIKTTKTLLSQHINNINKNIKKIARRYLCVGLIVGQIIWPFHYAGALPSFQTGTNIEQKSASTYNIKDIRAIAEWKSFEIKNDESVSFNTDKTSSILLNLVHGGKGSKIAGTLNADNIHFILIDPSGINIAGSSRIDVSSLVISTAGPSVGYESDFLMGGNLQLSDATNKKILIEASDGNQEINFENLILVGLNIENNASLTAPSGLVAMLATDNATLKLSDSDNLGVSFNASKLVDANLVNNGSIVADRVFLASQAANQAININNDIKAKQIVISGNKIELAAGLSGNGTNSKLTMGNGITNSDLDAQVLTSATEINLKNNNALVHGMLDSDIKAKDLIVGSGATDLKVAQATASNQASLAGLGTVNNVENIRFEHNKGSVTTNADASLGEDTHKLASQGINFTGIKEANLADNALTASSEQNNFDVTGEKALTAAEIGFTGISAVTGYNNEGHVDANAAAILNADTLALTTQGIDFTGIKTAGLGGNTLTASAEQNSFDVTGTNKLTAAEIDFSGISAVAGHNNQGHVDANSAANLTADTHALTTQGIDFTSIKTADLGGNQLTATDADQNSFDVTGKKALTAAEIDFSGVSAVAGHNNQGHVDTNSAANLTADANTLTAQSIDFTSIKTADLGGNQLTATDADQNSFDVTGKKALTAAEIDFSGVSAVAGHNNQGHVDTNSAANLTADANTLTAQSIDFTSIKTADLGGNQLTATDADQNSFVVTGNKVLTAAEIDFSGVSAVAGHNNQGHVDTNSAANLTADANTLTAQSIDFTSIKTADLGGNQLTATDADQNSFVVTGNKVLTAAEIDFSGVSAVAGHNNQGHVDTNSAANLTADANTLTAQSIDFTSIKTADLGGNQLTATDADQNSFDVTGKKALTAAEIDFSGVSAVAGHNNQGHVDTNSAANLTADANTLTAQSIDFTSIKTADLGGNQLTATDADQNSFDVTGKKALTAAGIGFTNVASAVGSEGKGALSTNADATLNESAGSLLTHGITLNGIETANLGNKKLTGSSAYNSFDVTGANALTAAAINFEQVSNVAGYNNQGHVNANAAVTLN